jgi:hypothetical protein
MREKNKTFFSLYIIIYTRMFCFLRCIKFISYYSRMEKSLKFATDIIRYISIWCYEQWINALYYVSGRELHDRQQYLKKYWMGMYVAEKLIIFHQINRLSLRAITYKAVYSVYYATVYNIILFSTPSLVAWHADIICVEKLSYEL